MAQGVFITGTDTGVGKTWVGTRLVQALFQHGKNIAPRKPVESGCALEQGHLQPADAMAYWDAVKRTQKLDDICPYRLQAIASPARAAQLEHQHIHLCDLVAACHIAEDNFAVVEGAGGICAPLTHDGNNLDLVSALSWPLLIVVADRLGCINHTLLTVLAAEQQGVDITAIVLNTIVGEEMCADLDNAAELRSYLSVPIVHTTDQSWLSQLTELFPI